MSSSAKLDTLVEPHKLLRVTSKDGKSNADFELEYVNTKIIGNGSFGVVYQAKVVKGTEESVQGNCERGDEVAIKKVLQDRRFKNRELQIMRIVSHPNIVSLKAYFYSRGDAKAEDVYLNLVLEYVPETVYRASRHFTRLKQTMPMLHIKLYMYQLFRSLAYIHSLGICHRDIKPQNLLVDQTTGVLKLCDFGSAKILVAGEPNVSYICSRYYRAPELIFGATNYTTSIDVWSAGCVMAELMLGQPIFPGDSGIDQLVEIIKVLGTPSREQIRNMNPSYVDHRFPQIRACPFNKVFRSRTPPEAIDLITKLLDYTPSKRLTSSDAMVHPFFDELRKPETRLPNGRELPALFDFSAHELSIRLDLLTRLVPPHAEAPLHATGIDVHNFTPIPEAELRVDRCSTAAWLPRFESVAFKSEVIELPEDFVHYLQEDGMFLPEQDTSHVLGRDTVRVGDSEDSDDLWNNAEQGEDTDTSGPNTKPHFPHVDRLIKDAIDRLKVLRSTDPVDPNSTQPAVFPKLNWSAPRDSTWITPTQSLKCTTPYEIYLLLKSSDFINHDLGYAYDQCVDGPTEDTARPQKVFLVLKQWVSLQSAMEFRIFVRDREIIAYCQRDGNFYPFLQDAELQADIEQRIHEFFEDWVRENFPDPHFVFDIYIAQDLRRTFLVDINPFGPQTDALLFSWEELLSGAPLDSSLRLITSQSEANARGCSAGSASTSILGSNLNSMPREIIEMSQGRTVAEFAEEFWKGMKGEIETDSEDEEEV
ncbi:hypothetical protein BZG36_03345 [Bifiguratus adelaidae]|uniref:Protein kinase domain-containing protein n=1 Tax=Bifiguratus adelaidae TaxID=1938954 RepID=A0A261XWM1_9FUNG|nr:hypothetical protein BZG36_03345 [Bifiguratus adelaidae]